MGSARYEYIEGSSSKFWQIELAGASFTTTHGKIGSTGQTLLKQWPDAATAKKEHDKLVAQKTKKGYVLVSAAKPAKAATPAKAAKGKAAKVAEPTASGGAYNAALAKVIDADPNDEGAWSVYADWLQSQNDPRGELAVVQERLRASPKDKALLSAEKKLLKDHAAAIVGDLAIYMTKEGKPDIPGVTAKPALEPEFRDYEDSGVPVAVQWRSGFFQQVSVGHPGFDWSPGTKKKRGEEDEGGDEGESMQVDAVKLVLSVLGNPAARFMTSLRIGMPNDPDDGECHFQPLLKKLAGHEALTRLRKLYLGDISQNESENSWVEIGDISKLYPSLKNLRSLTLRGNNRLKLGTINLPELRELSIVTGGLDKKNLEAIAAAKWPKLKKLELWLGDKNYGANSKIKDLSGLLSSKLFPKLQHLALCNCEYADDIAKALPSSTIVKQLESLDLSKGTLTEAGVAALVAGKAQLSHLKRMDLSDNFIGKSATAAATICPAVRTRPQRTADDYDGEVHRYVALGE
jgi:uncharacterized protein (TIGR02996 family)